jgi:putative ABC transport system ATP-binding protein
MFTTRSLTFSYNATVGFQFPDVELKDGQDLLLLGASGIGKTTLLHLIAGLIHPDSGHITLDDTRITELSRKQLDRFRGQHIGLVFQRPHFVQALNLEENLLLVQYLAGKKQDKQRVKAVLDRLGIGGKTKQYPHSMSLGEQQRATIAQALINEPRLILADEPTSSLDDENCNRVANLLKEQAAATHAHLVIITHDSRLKQVFEHMINL